MARVKYAAGEIDQNFQIEDGIRRTLSKNITAEVSSSVIESNYDLLDGNFDLIEGTLEDKCQKIAKNLGVEFSLRGKQIVFKRLGAA